MKLLRVSTLALAALLVLAASSGAHAASTILTATLNGTNERPDPGDPDGTGTAVVRLDPETGTITYSLFTGGIISGTAAHIHRGTSEVAGPVVVNFSPTFSGSPVFGNFYATGTVPADAALINEIIANPAGFYVNVHNPLYPAGAVRGQLTLNSGANLTEMVFPIVGALAGANGTQFRSDLALINLGSSESHVVLEYYASGEAGNAAPTDVHVFSLNSNNQEILEDVVREAFDLTSGSGAIRLIATQPLIATARIYNDLRPVDGGTFGQFVPAHTASMNRTAGVLPMLANQRAESNIGSRTNIGFFNAGTTPVTVTFNIHRFNGTVLESRTMTVAGRAQQQMPLPQIFPSAEPLDNLYVTFSTEGGPLYVYASVIDNITGDAVFIPAQ
jgi:hypothetical protein